MKRIVFLLLILQSVCAIGQNQVSPITITLPQNPSANIADWGTSASPFVILAQTKLQDGQVAGLVADSRVLVTIKNGGNKVCGSYTPSTAPSSNFNSATKIWTGGAATSLLGQDCTLPSGMYELCVQFFGFYNGRENIELGQSCKTFTIADRQQENCSPPQNINPSKEKTFTEKDLLKPITFNWSPIVSSFKGIITYKLFVWEVEDGQTNAQAIYNNQPILQEDIKGQTKFISKPGTWEKRNAKYVWRVIAVDEEGKPICKLSQSEPTNFIIEVKDQQQGKTCIDFEGQYPIANWYSYFVDDVSIAKNVSDAVNATQVLSLTDGQGGSIAINETEFAGNWLTLAQSGCFCFDYKVDWEASVGSNAGSFPKVHIFTGPHLNSLGDFQNATYATFAGNPANPLIQDNVWGKFCLPIELCKNGSLPSSSLGQWIIHKAGVLLTGAAACTEWDNLIQNVNGIVLPNDYNSSPSEIVKFDNFCWSCSGTPPEPKLCCDDNSKTGCLKIDTTKLKVECLGVDSTGKNIYKISNLILKNTSTSKAHTGLVTNTVGTNYIVPNPGSAFIIKNLSPVSANPINAGSQINISFEVHGLSASLISFFVDGTIMNTKELCEQHLPFVIDSLPSCDICLYCLDTKNSDIKTGASTQTVSGTNILSVGQQFTIAPKNIKRVTAEIISIKEDIVDTACLVCTTREDAVYSFMPHSTSSWNSGTALNGSPVNSSGYFPAKMVEWNCNQQGNLKFDVKIKLPAIKNTCKRKSTICIRYSFTDIDCNTCERTICYDIK